jgi:ribA/ribD-fused uncharacterized protein
VNEIKNGPISEIDMCNAIINVISASKLDGVQKVHNIWRIYVKDKTTRLELCIKDSIILNGHRVNLYDQNPNTLHAGINRNHKLDKLTIKYLPISLSHDEVGKMLKDKKVKLASDVKFTRVREATGQLTSYKNGDRFVFVEPFDPPIPKEQTVADFKCLVIHHGKDSPCAACGINGHKVGENICSAKPTETIMPFRTFQHPLSNQFPCVLNVFGKTFQSVDHAYLWRMATEFGKIGLGEEIAAAKHAGAAKRLSAGIFDDSQRWELEDENLDLMEELLQCKFAQCEQFKQCLLDNHGKVLAEASRDKLWGSGLSAYVTEHTAPDFWPGKNVLGAMLMHLTAHLDSNHPTFAQPEPAVDDTQSSPMPVSPRPFTVSPVASGATQGEGEGEGGTTAANAAPVPKAAPAALTAQVTPESELATSEETIDAAEEIAAPVLTAASTTSPQRSAKTGRHRPTHKTPADKRSQTHSTPNIKNYFEKKRLDKRKVLASSPDMDDSGLQGKIQKSDRAVS